MQRGIETIFSFDGNFLNAVWRLGGKFWVLANES
jgi:hypothetical protein